MIKKIILFCLILILIFIVGCSYWNKDTITETLVKETTTSSITQKTTAQTYKVIIENNKFKPIDLDIKVGDTVEWINQDSNQHTITFEDVRVNQVLIPGSKVSYTFKEKEEARYFCKFHPGMQGSVKVN